MLVAISGYLYGKIALQYGDEFSFFITGILSCVKHKYILILADENKN